MTKFSKKTIQKLKLHLKNIKNSISNSQFEKSNQKITDKKFQNYRILLKNTNVAEALMIESVFLNLEISNLTKSSLHSKLILKNKKRFTDKRLYNTSYLIISSYFKEDAKIKNLHKSIKTLILYINQKSLSAKQSIEHFIAIGSNNLNDSYKASKMYINKWYIYLNRFSVLTLIHIIPFVQLSTRLFFTYPNPLIANPVTGSTFSILPLFLRLIKIMGPILNNETFSFLSIGFYYKLFIISYKKYGISRKIAFQGTFAIALMLLNYCIVMANEITPLIYKFIKNFFFFTRVQNLDLIRDDVSFFIDDLEELRYYKETFLQWGESIFSLNETTKTLQINESLTIISVLSVIALLYNCVYFIIRGEKPIIPVVTKTVRRMMVDRSSDEF